MEDGTPKKFTTPAIVVIAKKGALAPEAKPGTLLRRASFDITGLPPTTEEMDAFLADTEAMYPGGWMGSPPIRDAKQRADLLCVLAGP